METIDHGIGACAEAVMQSPAAYRQVLDALAARSRDESLGGRETGLDRDCVATVIAEPRAVAGIAGGHGE